MFLLLIGCQRRQATACEELRQQTPDGLVLATDERRCAEVLEFAATVPERYGMEFNDWVNVVPAQRARLTLEAIYSLTERTTWHPATFSASPPKIPCGGMVLTDELWKQLPISAIVERRPATLYASMSIEIDKTSRAFIRILQDFDCDSKTGTMEIVGDFHQGLSPFAGGWTAISATEPEVDE